MYHAFCSWLMAMPLLKMVMQKVLAVLFNQPHQLVDTMKMILENFLFIKVFIPLNMFLDLWVILHLIFVYGLFL